MGCSPILQGLREIVGWVERISVTLADVTCDNRKKVLSASASATLEISMRYFMNLQVGYICEAVPQQIHQKNEIDLPQNHLTPAEYLL